MAIGRRVYSPVIPHPIDRLPYFNCGLNCRHHHNFKAQGLKFFRTLYSPLIIRDADGFIVWETAHRVAGRVLRG